MVDIPDMAIPQLKLSEIARAHPKQRLSCQKLKERPNVSLSKAKLFAKFYVTSSGQWHTCWKEACHLKSHCGVFPVFFLSTQCYRSLEEGMATTLVFLFGEAPWTEESGRLQSTGLQRVDMTETLKTAQCFRQGLCIGLSPHDRQSLLIHLLWT